MVKLSKITGVPYIITTDSHYLKKEDASIHKAFLQAQESEREVDSFYETTYLMDTEELECYFSKEELLGRLERNAKEMNDSLRSDYVVLMLSVADSSFMKTDDFVVFLNYLQGRCTEEYSEGIGYYLMNIYLNNHDKINRVE